MMEEALYTLLSSAISFPVAWGTLGDGDGVPRAAMYRTGLANEPHMNGVGKDETTVQIDCYGQTYAEAITASRDIRSTLDGYQGGVIKGVFLRSVRDGIDGDAQLLHRVSMTFSVHSRG